MGNFLTMLKNALGLGPTDPTVEVSPQDAFQRLKGGKTIQLVDVRSVDEHRQMRIAGSKLIPLHELGNRLKEIDKIKPVLLYCHGGNRSGMALRLLKSQGYNQAAHIVGGISSWSRSGLPVESK
jgi:adenylyltransferase/sulfurtransferase